MQKLMPGAVVDMVANVSRITGACQLLQGDATAQVQRMSLMVRNRKQTCSTSDVCQWQCAIHALWSI